MIFYISYFIGINKISYLKKVKLLKTIYNICKNIYNIYKEMIILENCVFCKIMKQEIPSYTIYEDDIVKVFLSIEPIANGHTLIVPKMHYKDITDIPIDALNHINKISKEIYDLLKEKLNFDGLKFVQNNGFFQDIPHYHLHLIPHYNNEEKKSLEEIYDILKK